MRYVALTGLAGSGKSTVTELLHTRFHYRWADFTGLLKREFAQQAGIPVQAVEASKEVYRQSLQEYASIHGFDARPRWMLQALKECGWLDDTTQPVVFDNVRTPEQAYVLSALGLGIVRIVIFREESSRRLRLTDLSFMEHRADRGLDSHYVWREVNGYCTPEDIARCIVELPDLPTLRLPDTTANGYSAQAVHPLLGSGHATSSGW